MRLAHYRLHPCPTRLLPACPVWQGIDASTHRKSSMDGGHRTGLLEARFSPTISIRMLLGCSDLAGLNVRCSTAPLAALPCITMPAPPHFLGGARGIAPHACIVSSAREAPDTRHPMVRTPGWNRKKREEKKVERWVCGSKFVPPLLWWHYDPPFRLQCLPTASAYHSHFKAHPEQLDRRRHPRGGGSAGRRRDWRTTCSLQWSW